MVTLFGTDGVRGVVNATLLPELAFQLSKSGGPTNGFKTERSSTWMP